MQYIVRVKEQRVRSFVVEAGSECDAIEKFVEHRDPYSAFKELELEISDEKYSAERMYDNNPAKGESSNEEKQ